MFKHDVRGKLSWEAFQIVVFIFHLSFSAFAVKFMNGGKDSNLRKGWALIRVSLMEKNTWTAASVICSERSDFKGMQAVEIANKFPFIADDMCVEVVSLCFLFASVHIFRNFSSFFCSFFRLLI